MRILFMDVDTLRPDHMGCYGYFRNTTPNLDRLLAEQPCFDRSGLAVRGSDLLPLGYQGKEIGQALDRLVAAVIDGKSENKKEVLLDFLKQSQK